MCQFELGALEALLGVWEALAIRRDMLRLMSADFLDRPVLKAKARTSRLPSGVDGNSISAVR